MKRSDFPKGFIFGAATAAYQIEGHHYGGAGATIWDKFAQDGGVYKNHDGAKACDHYHRYEEDLGLLKNAGFDAYRFSMSWSRVMPDGHSINQEGLDYYDRVIDAMLARNFKPFATAYHWELPLALGEKGGWAKRETAELFGDYMGLLARKFGDRLESLASINEPWCVAWLSHFEGHHAPGIKNISVAAKAMHYILLAHGKGVEAARAETNKPLGIVLNFEPAYPATDTNADRDAAARHNAIYNHWFIQAITKGTYPQICLDGFGAHLPKNWQDDMTLISKPIDFLGINYYTRKLARAKAGDFPALEMVDGDLPQTDMGWEISPEAFDELFDHITGYTGDLPLYVTENGMASANPIDDPDRISYFEKHLDVVARRAKTLPIKGYFAWSLLDNYEWAFGYEKRFGIVHVDYETMERTPKESYHWFKTGIL